MRCQRFVVGPQRDSEAVTPVDERLDSGLERSHRTPDVRESSRKLNLEARDLTARMGDSGKDIAREQTQSELVRVVENNRVVRWEVERSGDRDCRRRRSAGRRARPSDNRGIGRRRRPMRTSLLHPQRFGCCDTRRGRAGDPTHRPAWPPSLHTDGAGVTANDIAHPVVPPQAGVRGHPATRRRGAVIGYPPQPRRCWCDARSESTHPSAASARSTTLSHGRESTTGTPWRSHSERKNASSSQLALARSGCAPPSRAT